MFNARYFFSTHSAQPAPDGAAGSVIKRTKPNIQRLAKKLLIASTLFSALGLASSVAVAQERINPGDKVQLQTADGKWVVADYGGTYPTTISANSSNRGAWETFTLLFDPSSSPTSPYNFVTHKGTHVHYRSVNKIHVANPARSLDEGRYHLQINDINGGQLLSGDRITIKSSYTQRFWSAPLYGTLNANAAVAGHSEQFHIFLPDASDCVQLFEKPGFGGKKWFFDCGRAEPKHSEWNDKVRSMKIPAGKRLTGFQHADYTGSMAQYMGSVYNIGDFTGMSSFRINSVNTSSLANCLQFYELPNYQGRTWVWGCGFPEPTDSKWNDKVRSMKVPAGEILTGYQHSNKTGSYAQYLGSVSNVGDFTGMSAFTTSHISKSDLANCLQFYEFPNYQGRVWIWECNQPRPQHSQWNDNVGSMKIPNRQLLTVFKHSNGGGNSWNFYGNNPSTGDWQNDISDWTMNPFDKSKSAFNFAPILLFDRAAKDYGYPMDAQEYYDECVLKPCAKKQNTDLSKVQQNKIPTYYTKTERNGQIRIMYWFFYGHQEPCNDTGIGDSGEHPSDWERIMVTTTQDQVNIAAVTFFQHGGYYTRIADPRGGECNPAGSGRCYGDGGFRKALTHPLVYVGKIAHGSYHNEGSFGSDINIVKCGYFSDFRNPRETIDRMDTAYKLVNLQAEPSGFSFIEALREKRNDTDGFPWGHPASDGDPVSTNPLDDDNLPGFDLRACKGKAFFSNGIGDDNGCYLSECLSEDDQELTWCEKECPTGYTNMGLYCQKGITGWLNKDRYDFNYIIPDNDAGLSRRRNLNSADERELPHADMRF